MPTYVYECRECSIMFEEVQKITEDSLVTCPHCGKDGLYRVIQPSNWIIDGPSTPGVTTTSSKAIRDMKKNVKFKKEI